MRQCSIYKCTEVDEWRCCADCERVECANRCKNHPARCKCVKDPAPVRSANNCPVIDPEEVLALAKDGMSNVAISVRLGCTPDWVAKILRKAGYKRPRVKKGDASNGL